MRIEKWLIVGTGSISDSFVQDLQTLKQEIIGVVSRNLDSAKVFADKHGIKNIFTYENIDCEYDNVYVGTPNATHYDIAKSFILKNKNVLVEKIMTHNPQLTRELFELGDKHNVRVMEAYAHFYPGFVEEYRNKAHKTLNIDYLQLSSKIKNNTARFASTFRKDTFGGVMPDLGVYPISLAIWLNGPVESIKVLDYEFFENEVEINVSYQLIHKNGCVTTSRVSKLEDGDNAVYLDEQKIITHVSGFDRADRMTHEIKTFVEGNYKFSRDISIEVSDIIAEFKKICVLK